MERKNTLMIVMIIVMTIFAGCSSNVVDEEDVKVNSFEECAKQGGKIGESYPRQCFIGEETFVEEIIEDDNIEDIESFRGEIIEIENGKDGSTLTLKNEDGIIIHSTVSIPNLGVDSTFNFEDVVIGNIIDVSGETFMMNDVKQLTAKYAVIIHSEKENGKCLENGGNYEKMGMLQMYQCNMPAKDSGKTCSDSKECEGSCLAETKTCSENTINFGCIPILENGEEVTICID